MKEKIENIFHKKKTLKIKRLFSMFFFLKIKATSQ